MSHHYQEDNHPYTSSRRISVNPPSVTDKTTEELIQKTRQRTQEQVLTSLAKQLSNSIGSMHDQRDPSTPRDIYVIAKAYCQQYEDMYS